MPLIFLPQNWSIRAQVTAIAGFMAALVSLLASWDYIATAQPLATKRFVLAQYSVVVGDVREIRWAQIEGQINNLRKDLRDDRFKLIQLKDLLERDPTDTIKRQVLGDLEAGMADKQAELNRLTCMLANKNTDGGKNC